MTAYAHPEMLVETSWLAERLDQRDLRIVDARPAIEYLLGHIPGAVNIPIPGWNLKDPDNPAIVVSPDQFARIMETCGIGDGAQVIAYDGDGGHHASRLWWAMEYYGHPGAVRLLNGGWDKWRAEKRPFTTQVPYPPPARFTPSLTPHLAATVDDLKSIIGTPAAVLLDVRSDEEWEGKDKRSNRYGGHLPGAVHHEWKRSMTDDALKTWLPADELRRRFAATGVTPGKAVVTY